MKRIVYFALFVFFVCSCSRKSNVEKFQNHTTNIIDVKELVKEIVIDTPLIGGWARPFIINDYLLISDSQSEENLVSIFDKNNFS